MIRRLDVKIVVAIIVTIFLPLGFSVYLVASLMDTTLGLGVNENMAAQTQRSLEIRRDHIEALKASAKARFDHLSESYVIAQAHEVSDDDLRLHIKSLIDKDPLLHMIRLTGPDGAFMEVESDIVLDPKKIRATTKNGPAKIGPYNNIEATFVLDASILEELQTAGKDFETYKALVNAPPTYLKNRFMMVYLIMLGITVVMSILIGVLWTRRLAGRIHGLSVATQSVAAGDLSVRVEPGSKDEVGQLVESFNGMVSELSEYRTRIEYLQKISAWQEMARRLAHEIKNPLTPIQLATQQLRKKYDGDDPKFKRLLEQSAEIIEEEIATLRRLTTDFSTFAKLPQVRPEPVELSEFLDECEASIRPVVEQEDVGISFEAPSRSFVLQIDRMMLRRVIDNLVRNAFEALLAGSVDEPQVRVSVKEIKTSKRHQVDIRVADNGPGISDDNRVTIFDPYFTTKNEGTGLGLAISKKIILEHGGFIRLDEQQEQGATFIISLPITRGRSKTPQ